MSLVSQTKINSARKKSASFMIFFLAMSFVVSPSFSSTPDGVYLPTPGERVSASESYSPVIMEGMTIYPEDPLKLTFIISAGDEHLQGEDFQEETQKLIRYFFATLTVPDDELWVNLSPYEKDRIIAEGLGGTEMGRDMLAQDYVLKQLTASMMYPEEDLGEEFWKRVYEKAQAKLGGTQIPINTFNKVWIVPDEVVVYINGTNVFVSKSHLKVMLEEDYLVLESNIDSVKHGLGQVTKDDIEQMSQEVKAIIREVFLPEIEREVNEGRHFATLRQIYHAMILATWYKNHLRTSVLGRVYVNKNKIQGIALEDMQIKEKIYGQYIAAFQKGVFDYIRTDYDPATQAIIPRRYFSGGVRFVDVAKMTQEEETLSPGSGIKQTQKDPGGVARADVKVELTGEGGEVVVAGQDQRKSLAEKLDKVLDDQSEMSYGYMVDKNTGLREEILDQESADQVTKSLKDVLQLLRDNDALTLDQEGIKKILKMVLLDNDAWGSVLGDILDLSFDRDPAGFASLLEIMRSSDLEDFEELDTGDMWTLSQLPIFHPYRYSRATAPIEWTPVMVDHFLEILDISNQEFAWEKRPPERLYFVSAVRESFLSEKSFRAQLLPRLNDGRVAVVAREAVAEGIYQAMLNDHRIKMPPEWIDYFIGALPDDINGRPFLTHVRALGAALSSNRDIKIPAATMTRLFAALETSSTSSRFYAGLAITQALVNDPSNFGAAVEAFDSVTGRLAVQELGIALRRFLFYQSTAAALQRQDLLGFLDVQNDTGKQELFRNVVEPLYLMRRDLFDRDLVAAFHRSFAPVVPEIAYFMPKDKDGIPFDNNAVDSPYRDVREYFSEKILKGPARVLIIYNVADGLGDERYRVDPLVQALLDGNNELEVTVMTGERRHFYHHPRVKTIDIRESGLSEEKYDLLVSYDYPGRPRPGVATRALRSLRYGYSQDYLKEGAVFISSNKDNDDVEFNIQINGDTVGNPVVHGDNVYLSSSRLMALLGIPSLGKPVQRSLLTAIENPSARQYWDENIVPKMTTGAQPRPVVIFQGFGGMRTDKGFDDSPAGTDQFKRVVEGLVGEGKVVVVLSNYGARGFSSQRAVKKLLETLDPDIKRHVDIPPGPEAAPDLYAYLIQYAADTGGEVLTVEGGIGHLAQSIGADTVILDMGRSDLSKFLPPTINPQGRYILRSWTDLVGEDTARMTPGGIDLNPGIMAFSETGQAGDFSLENPLLDQIPGDSVRGILPTIMNITPVIDFVPLVGAGNIRPD